MLIKLEVIKEQYSFSSIFHMIVAVIFLLVVGYTALQVARISNRIKRERDATESRDQAP